jgi:hypothetical protein
MKGGCCRPGGAGLACERITVSAPDGEAIERIEAALREWRQGDATLDAEAFIVHLADKRTPLTVQAREAAAEAAPEYNVFEVLSTVRGLVVVTQTCDVVRKCAVSEYVEVSPLVYIDDDSRLQAVRKARMPRYAYMPGLAGQKLVADLDRTMTVEKAVVAGWTRLAGCTTDAERAAFANALARKRQRFAFPDGFNDGLKRFRDRIRDKEGKATAEGRLIATLGQIRVQASPHWNAPRVTVHFWFLVETGETLDFDAARKTIGDWLGRTALASPFALADPAFSLVEPRDMTVQDYLSSYPLDYDDVSP